MLTFSGGRLADAQEDPRLLPRASRSRSSKSSTTATVKATVKIAADCRLGEHAFRVRTATGISRTAHVLGRRAAGRRGEGAEQRVRQAAADPAQRHRSRRRRQRGRRLLRRRVQEGPAAVGRGRRDAARRHVLRSRTSRSSTRSGSSWRPATTRRCRSRTAAARSWSRPTASTSSRFARAPTAATARASTGCTSARSRGRPAVVPAGGKPGEEVEVTFLGDPAGPIKQKVKLPADDGTASSAAPLPGRRTASARPGFQFRVSDLPQRDRESSRTTPPQTATAGAAARRVQRRHREAGRGRLLQVRGQEGAGVRRPLLRPAARLAARPGHVPRQRGRRRHRRQRRRHRPGQLLPRRRSPKTASTRSACSDHLKKGGPDYFYRIEVTPVQPKTDDDDSAAWTATTPRTRTGRRSPCRRAAAMRRCSSRTAPTSAAPLVMGLEKLPPGVTLAADQMDPGLNVVPVVFEAKPDAADRRVPRDHHRDARRPEGEGAVRRPRSTRSSASGPNNAPYMRHYTDRTAVAVGEAAPYSIEVIEPKVPLVQNGSFNLQSRREARGRLQGRDHGLPALDAAGRRAFRARRSFPKDRPSVCCR